MKKNVYIGGYSGDIGKRLIFILEKDKDLKYFRGSDIKSPPKNADISKCDVIVDFSSRELTLSLCSLALEHEKPMVIGTTGLTDTDSKKIATYAKNIPIVIAPNMSVGVNVLYKIIESMNKYLPDSEKEIVEIHHNRKKDAPSGTAKKLVQILSGKKDTIITERSGICGPRDKNEIGVFAVRGGDTAGEHTIYFFGDGERIEIKHACSNRNAFAHGAILAAKFVIKKPAGLYNMAEVLNII